MRVLFFHYADYLETGIPGGIAILSAVLKQHGHQTEVFDTTFLKPAHYRMSPKGGNIFYKKTPYSLEDLVRDDPVVDIKEEFRRVLRGYRPGLVSVSAMTTNIDETLDILREVPPGCPVVLGGVHATLSPEELLDEGVVDFVCIGEGEGPLVELCEALEAGRDPSRIENIWLRRNGEIIRNPLRPFDDLDRLPAPDWSIFDDRHLFRPFEGSVYRGSFVTTSRGCPSGCTYCVNGALRRIMKGCGRYFRRQSPAKTIRDIRCLKERYKATWFKFADDTFLLHSESELRMLRDGLKELSIKFGCSVQPSTVTETKVRLAKEMGCVAMSVGVESGNEMLRNKILNRRISNRRLERAIRIIMDAGIRVSTFNMIGLPYESREDVFETIRFNKKLGIKACNVYILYPFPQTEIARSFGLKHRDSSGRMIPMSEASSFGLSKMAPTELHGLLKTFNLYLLLPESEWGAVREAEGEGERAEERYRELEAEAAQYL